MDYMSLKELDRAHAHLMTAWEIAEHLNFSVNTVKSHLSEAMKKLHVKTRKGLKQYMLR